MRRQNSKFTQNIAKQVLWLIVPMPSIGVTMTTFIAPGLIGKTLFTIIKIWIVLIPWLWFTRIEKKILKLPKISRKQINYGIILGLIMFAAIVVSYLLLGRILINISEIRSQAMAVGINSQFIYILGCTYWCFINSFIEECIWRGFIYRQCRVLFSGFTAIFISALFFTLHHIIALAFYTQNWFITGLGSFGVLFAGIIWSFSYHKYGFWTCYISHILADIAIAIVGWYLLFV